MQRATDAVLPQVAAAGSGCYVQLSFNSSVGKEISYVHEMSIAQSLLEIVLEEAERHGVQRINKVRVQIGALVAEVPESYTGQFLKKILHIARPA